MSHPIPTDPRSDAAGPREPSEPSARYGPIWIDRHGWTIRIDGDTVTASADPVRVDSDFCPPWLMRAPRVPVIVEIVAGATATTYAASMTDTPTPVDPTQPQPEPQPDDDGTETSEA
jgi:hypothetical protein